MFPSDLPMKTCTECQASLTAEQFYRGCSKCKECTKAAVRRNRAGKLDYYRKYDRVRNMLPDRVLAREEYARTDRWRSVLRAVKQRWAARNSPKRFAQWTLGNAVRDGRAFPRPCEKCGRKAHAHHDDYDKPLDVRWLCPKHHKEHHMATGSPS